MKLPALKAHHGTFHRQDVLSITKPAEGLKGGEVGIFWDQEIGLEIIRRVNAYPKLVEALHRLMKEAAATAALAEPQIRDVCGHTNFACLIHAINEAGAVHLAGNTK
jgi:hypothetical protein